MRRTQLDAVETVERVAARIAAGRLPSFAEAHVIKALEEIDRQKGLGRLKLSKELHLGEGEARTLVKHLRNEGLIEISRSGISLSATGRRLLSRLKAVLSEQIDIPSTRLTVAAFNIAVGVRGMKNSVRHGLEQRDAAVMAGAKGATTLVFTKNRLTMPGDEEDLSGIDPIILAALSKLSLNEGDVIIIGSADEKIRAELGAKTAAIELLKSKSRAGSHGNSYE
jgi:hypothetical protein